MKRLSLLFIGFLACAVSALAVPARSRQFSHTQADGSTLELMLVGDEYHHYYLNTATNERMIRRADGDFVALTESELNRRMTYGESRRKEANALRRERLKTLPQRVARPVEGPSRVGQFGDMRGQKKGLVILVNFTDKKMASTHTQTTFNNIFNQVGYSANGHIGCVADYFKAQSYGQFELDFDVVGPVTTANKMAYYGGNDSNGDDLRPATMVIEACRAVDGQVNFADYDWDGDGTVDQVFVIYAGYGEHAGASENTIWPHEYELSSAAQYGDGTGKLKLDNVWINTYACAPELTGASGSALNGIGTACHEFSHCLGYPDTYDIDYSGGIGMDYYDVMCSGSYNGPSSDGEVPSGYTAYERWCAGWLTPVELNGPANIVNMPDLATSPTAYVIYNSANRDEFLLLENRQSAGYFRYYGSSIAGHGLFITHIDYNESVWADNAPNDTKTHQRVTWVPADKNYGTYSSIYGDWTVTSAQQKGDYFPGTGNVTSFDASQYGNYGGKWFKAENGSNYTSHTLSEISESQGTISFLVDGGDLPDRYTITYNAGSGTCETTSWTQTASSYEQATLPAATIALEGWTFAGWAKNSVAETTVKPTLYQAGASYRPMGDITLYAVYQRASQQGGVGGTYVLDYNAETNLQKAAMGYGKDFSYTASDGSAWTIKAYKNKGLQINKGKNASIKVPECAGAITTIELTTTAAKVLKFSTTDYNGSNNPTASATATASTSPTIDLTGKGLKTGYIYTTDGATTITKITVHYGAGGIVTYNTNPQPQVTGIEQQNAPRANKLLRNGQICILRDGKLYDLNGRAIR